MLRKQLTDRIGLAIRHAPVVALLGPRQSGKTTLARKFAASGALPFDASLAYFDLEDPRQIERLVHARLALEPLRGLVVVDEVQRRPDLFPILRVLADREGTPARFLILGSASRDLIRQSSESLAGRIHFIDVVPFSLEEAGAESVDTLWIRGGFPPSFLAESDEISGYVDGACAPALAREQRQAADQDAEDLLPRYGDPAPPYRDPVERPGQRQPDRALPEGAGR